VSEVDVITTFYAVIAKFSSDLYGLKPAHKTKPLALARQWLGVAKASSLQLAVNSQQPAGFTQQQR
jgi:hypothetical protein